MLKVETNLHVSVVPWTLNTDGHVDACCFVKPVVLAELEQAFWSSGLPICP